MWQPQLRDQEGTPLLSQFSLKLTSRPVDMDQQKSFLLSKRARITHSVAHLPLYLFTLTNKKIWYQVVIIIFFLIGQFHFLFNFYFSNMSTMPDWMYRKMRVDRCANAGNWRSTLTKSVGANGSFRRKHSRPNIVLDGVRSHWLRYYRMTQWSLVKPCVVFGC